MYASYMIDMQASSTKSASLNNICIYFNIYVSYMNMICKQVQPNQICKIYILLNMYTCIIHEYDMCMQVQPN